MVGMEDELERILQTPSELRISRSDDSVDSFTNFTRAPDWVGNGCALKCLPSDAFVITAYSTDSLKAGEIVWPKK